MTFYSNWNYNTSESLTSHHKFESTGVNLGYLTKNEGAICIQRRVDGIRRGTIAPQLSSRHVVTFMQLPGFAAEGVWRQLRCGQGCLNCVLPVTWGRQRLVPRSYKCMGDVIPLTAWKSMEGLEGKVVAWTSWRGSVDNENFQTAGLTIWIHIMHLQRYEVTIRRLILRFVKAEKNKQKNDMRGNHYYDS